MGGGPDAVVPGPREESRGAAPEAPETGPEPTRASARWQAASPVDGAARDVIEPQQDRRNSVAGYKRSRPRQDGVFVWSQPFESIADAQRGTALQYSFIALAAATGAMVGGGQARRRARSDLHRRLHRRSVPLVTVVAEGFGRTSTCKTPKIESTGSGLSSFAPGVGTPTSPTPAVPSRCSRSRPAARTASMRSSRGAAIGREYRTARACVPEPLSSLIRGVLSPPVRRRT